MNVCIFYYDGFLGYEIMFAASLFDEKNVFSAALENRSYISGEKQRFLPDKTISELNLDDIDVFIIPGGAGNDNLYNNSILRDFITKLNNSKKVIAGICGGVFLMANYGILDNKKCTGDGEGIQLDSEFSYLFDKSHVVNEDVVTDENIITSTGQAFMEFAFEIAKKMNIYDNDDDMLTAYRWLKNIK
ncbi:DJ-1/PfpI family protein [Clostridium sp. Marseille-Q7071]